MKKTYYTVDGTIIGESAAGVRTDYMTDALGSVTGTLNQSGQVLNTYRYKPYGGLLAKTGTSSDPRFQWAGSLGYRTTSELHSDYYVRARHFSSAEESWTSVDPLQEIPARSVALAARAPSVGSGRAKQTRRLAEGPVGFPDLRAYAYAGCSPASWTDATGLIRGVGVVGPVPGPDNTIVGNAAGASCGTVQLSTVGSVGYTISATICKACYATCNCSRNCLSASISASWGVSLDFFGSLSKLMDEVSELAETILQSFDNLIGGSIGLQDATCAQGCPPPVSEIQLRVCLSACGGATTLSACLGTGGTSGGVTSGPCWPIGASIGVTLEYDYCQ